jgi:hypothetical protein
MATRKRPDARRGPLSEKGAGESRRCSRSRMEEARDVRSRPRLFRACYVRSRESGVLSIGGLSRKNQVSIGRFRQALRPQLRKSPNRPHPLRPLATKASKSNTTPSETLPDADSRLATARRPNSADALSRPSPQPGLPGTCPSAPGSGLTWAPDRSTIISLLVSN